MIGKKLLGFNGCFLLDLEKGDYRFEELQIDYQNYYHSANLFKGSVYLFGGPLIKDNALRAIDVKDFSMKTINDVNGNPPSVRSGHSSEIVNR